MVTKCSGCDAVIFNILFMECSNSSCKKIYDLKCLGIAQGKFDSLSQEEKENWICPECLCSNPKTGNSETPVRTNPLVFNRTFTPSTNITMLRGSNNNKMNLDITTDNDSEDKLLLSEFREFRYEMFTRFEKQAEQLRKMEELLFRNESELCVLRETLNVVQEKAKKADVLEQQLKILLNRNDHSNDRLSEINMMQNNICETKVQAQNETAQKPTFANIVKEKVDVGNTDKSVRATKSEATKRATLPRSEMAIDTNKVNVKAKENVGTLTNDHNEWRTVDRKKNKFVSKEIRKGGNTCILDIQATERKKHLHVWRLKKDTSAECLENYVKSICGSDISVKVEKIRHKTERDYSSFIIGVPESKFQKLCQPDIWPLNAEFSEWVWFRRSAEKPRTQAQSN